MATPRPPRRPADADDPRDGGDPGGRGAHDRALGAADTAVGATPNPEWAEFAVDPDLLRLQALLDPYGYGPERVAALGRLFRDDAGVWQLRTLRGVDSGDPPVD